ncbi:hypothetical protein [Chromobacterium subtsugae]|uniref:hypothetical protein n=1 Tax=Chromobacterium subtsugae TaxID=251747 RepID=UPI0007F9383E|nr:hypothetical protein [Chromobacterium subtsugae]OBU84570.1 hypothetical protein MY55_21295 [Chromobacterium subtsugae]
MSQEQKPVDVTMDIDIPAPEAADLAGRAAAHGISTQQYLGLHTLRSAYGVLHPRVAELDRLESAVEE